MNECVSMNLKDSEESGEYICTCTLYWPNECNFSTLEDYLCYRMVLIAVMGTGSQSVGRAVLYGASLGVGTGGIQYRITCMEVDGGKKIFECLEGPIFYMWQALSIHRETGIGKFNILTFYVVLYGMHAGDSAEVTSHS